LILGEPLGVWVPLEYPLPTKHACIPLSVHQFHVVVQGISPLIWRRLLSCNDMSLASLHAELHIVFA
jgi:hypothetical protein